MHEIEMWIKQAACKQNINLRRLSDDDARLVEEAARRRYVKGNPRAWWLSLNSVCETYDSRAVEPSTVFPDRSGSCWFLPETDEAHLPVYEVDVTQIQRLLSDCPFFEYNIVSRDFSWLVAESDHNVYFVCRAKAANDSD